MLKGKSLLDYASLFSPSKYEKNNKTILKYFQLLKIYFMNRFQKAMMNRTYCIKCNKNRIFKNPKYQTFLIKQIFLLFVISVAVKMKKYLKKKNQLRY